MSKVEPKVTTRDFTIAKTESVDTVLNDKLRDFTVKTYCDNETEIFLQELFQEDRVAFDLCR
jgi:hypothetical protein